MAADLHLEFKNHILSRDCHRVPNVLLCTKVHQNRIFLPRDAMHKRGPCRHAVSVRRSVCHVRESCQNE